MHKKGIKKKKKHKVFIFLYCSAQFWIVHSALYLPLNYNNIRDRKFESFKPHVGL